MNNSLDKKNFIWNTIGSTFNSFTSLLFMIVLTRINGTNQSGIFAFCFSLACLLQIIGTYSGRTYQVSNKDKNIVDSDFIYSRFFTTLIMFTVAIIYCLIKGYNLEKIEEVLNRHNLDLSVRAEQLSTEIFIEIANNL